MLILSILALFAAPALYLWLKRGGVLARTVDTLIVAALVVLVVFLLLPESFSGLGAWAIALIAAGYLAPGLMELLIRRAAHTLHVIALLLALAGLALHAALDGAGLVASNQQASATLALAIILHRFGVGLVLWLMVEPVFGRSGALAVLAVIASMTVVGYFMSGQLLDLEGGGQLLAVQAFITGTIIHSLVHRGHGHRH